MEREAKDQSFWRPGLMAHYGWVCSRLHWRGSRWHHGWLCQWVKAWTRVSFDVQCANIDWIIANTFTAKQMQKAAAAHRSPKLA